MKLKDYLKENKLTEVNFAEMLGCKQPTISRYINKKRIPKKQIMQKINELTNGNVNKNDFQRGEDNGEISAN